MLFNVLIETEMFIWESSVRACFKTSVNIILLKNTVKKRNVMFIDVRNVFTRVISLTNSAWFVMFKRIKGCEWY